MSDDDFGRVPAGWYPDPLGLPQLRWWDNHAWTEHVSDARQPMMPTQPAAPTIFADDDELPSRRSRRTADSGAADETPLEQPTAAVLRQLAPPTTDDAPVLIEPVVPSASVPSASVPSVPAAPAQSAPAAPATAASAADAFAAAAFADLKAQSAAASAGQSDAPWVPLQGQSGPVSAGAAAGYGSMTGTSAPAGSAPQGSAPQGFSSAPGYGSAPGYTSAPGYGSAPGAPAYVPTWTESPVSASDPGRRGTHQTLGTTAPHLQSVEIWAIALLPMLQLLLSLLVLAAFSTGPSVIYMAVIWLAPYPVTLVLAFFDYRSLSRRGVDRPASWLWALGSAPLYLVARAVRLSRISGAGYGPLAVFLLLSGLVGASVLAVPGLIIAALPGVFAAEASNSIELAARSIGGNMQVECPPTPPLFIGQQLRCPAIDAGGNAVVITASLQRSNGWIAWQVDDWGVFSIVR